MPPPLSWRTQSVSACGVAQLEGGAWAGRGNRPVLPLGGKASPDSAGKAEGHDGDDGRFQVAERTHETAAPAIPGRAPAGVMDMHVMRYLRDVKLLADVTGPCGRFFRKSRTGGVNR